jgi:rubrerythrin
MIKSRLEFEIYDEKEAVETVQAVIPLARAGVCIECNRVFTMLGSDRCPVCQSLAWVPVRQWIDGGKLKAKASMEAKEVA